MADSPSKTADRKPGRSGGGTVWGLAALFLMALGAATFLQLEARLGELDRRANAQAQAVATAAAGQIDTVVAHAWGVMVGAGGAQAGAPAAAVRAIGRARGVKSAALADRNGRIEAAWGPDAAAIAAAALRAAPPEGDWAGLTPAAGADGRPAPVLVRRTASGVMVAVLDPEIITPSAAPGWRLAIASEGGDVVAARHGEEASPAQTIAEALGLAQAPSLAPAGRTGATLPSPEGGRASFGAAGVAINGLVVAAASPIAHTWAGVLPALSAALLLALAPMAAVAALLMLLRQNAKRAAEAEAEAARAERRVRLTADGAHAGIFEWTLVDNRIALSQEAMRILRAQGEELNLSALLALAAPEDRTAAQDAFRKARQTGALDARFRITEGPVIAWIEARGLGLEEQEGQGAQRIVGTVVDVTRRWEAEMRASRLERRLREAIESYSGPFALWDSRRRLLLWNHSYAEAFRLEPDVLRAGASYESLAMAASATIRRESVDTGDAQSREIEVASGEWLRIVERRTAEGGLVTVGIDITDLKRQEQALTENRHRLLDLVARLETSELRNKALAREAVEARQQAVEASNAKSAFLANMSHELRTPLNAVIGFSEIMSKELFGKIGNEQYKQYAQDIFHSGTHLLDLINDVLDMAKIEAGRMNLKPGPMDPEVAIEQAIRLMRRRAEEKNLQLLSDLEDLPEIEADHRAVKQMMINLISNAIKFTDHGAVMVQGRATAEGLELRVVDTGRGIPEADLPRLAKPFEQVEVGDHTRATSGTGLGLALTKSMAEMHGGALRIESQLGRGTVVSIRLPRKFAPSDTAVPDRHAAE